MAKERQIIRVSGTAQNGTAANVSITSDAIPFEKDAPWVLNVWFTNLVVSGKQPEVTIEVSSTSDVNSFKGLMDAENIPVPELIEDNISQWNYFRIVYTANGASSGTKNFDLFKLL